MPLNPEVRGARLRFCNPKDSTLTSRGFYALLRHVLNTYGSDSPHAFRFVGQRALGEVPHVETESRSRKKGMSKRKTRQVPPEKTKKKKGRRVGAHDGDDDDEDGDISEGEELDLDGLSSDSGGSIQAGPSSVPLRMNPSRKGKPSKFNQPEASDSDPSGAEEDPILSPAQNASPAPRSTVTKVAQEGKGRPARSKSLVGDAQPTSTRRSHSKPAVSKVRSSQGVEPNVGEPSVSEQAVAGDILVSQGGERGVSSGGDPSVSGQQIQIASTPLEPQNGKPCFPI